MRRAVLLISEKIQLTFLEKSKIVVSIDVDNTKSAAELLYKTDIEQLDIVFKGTVSKNRIDNTYKIASLGKYYSLITDTDYDYIGDLISVLGINKVFVHDYVSYILKKYPNEKVIVVDRYPNCYGVMVVNDGELLDFRKAFTSNIKFTLENLKEYYKAPVVFAPDKLESNLISSCIYNHKLIDKKFYECIGYIPYVLMTEGKSMTRDASYENVFENDSNDSMEEVINSASKKPRAEILNELKEDKDLDDTKESKSSFFGRLPRPKKKKKIIAPDYTDEYDRLESDTDYSKSNFMGRLIIFMLSCVIIFGVIWTFIYQGKVELVRNNQLIIQEQTDAVKSILEKGNNPLETTTFMFHGTSIDKIESVTGNTKSFVVLYKDSGDGEAFRKYVLTKYKVSGGSKIGTTATTNTYKLLIDL